MWNTEEAADLFEQDTEQVLFGQVILVQAADGFITNLTPAIAAP